MYHDPDFVLAPRLAADTLAVGDLPLCRVLRMNDARYPWLLLVPRRAGMQAIDQLDRAQRLQLMDEIDLASRVLRQHGDAPHINVAALGNIVRQLHVHVVARHAHDPAWPGPVWGHGEPLPLVESDRRLAVVDALRKHFAKLAGPGFSPAEAG